MKEQELKPCPFCGGEAEIRRKGNRHHSSVIVCVDCGARLESNESDWNTGSSWNERAARRLVPMDHTISPDGTATPVVVNSPAAPKSEIGAGAGEPWTVELYGPDIEMRKVMSGNICVASCMGPTEAEELVAAHTAAVTTLSARAEEAERKLAKAEEALKWMSKNRALTIFIEEPPHVTNFFEKCDAYFSSTKGANS